MSKWFLQQHGLIKGPFSNEEMQQTLAQISDAQLEGAYCWKRGFTEWLKASKWRVDLVAPAQSPETINSVGSVSNETVTTMTVSQTKSEVARYRVQLNFVDQPMMTKLELLTFIGGQADVSKISIQNPKTKEWSEVYAFPDIVEKLGISRRKNSRVPILATFIGTNNSQAGLNVKVVTVSEGGMGFTEVFNLKIGDLVEGQLLSPHFFQPIHLTAEVVYSGQDGYIGLRFGNINDESRSVIMDYVKKFGKSQLQS